MKYEVKYPHYASEKGMRPTNEDEHIVAKYGKVKFYGIFDGHGGSKVSQFLKKNVYKFFVGEKIKMPIRTAYIKKVHETIQRKLIEEYPNASKWSGSTSLYIIRVDKKVIISNLGDCRAVLCRDGLALPLTKDHKPNWSDERERISKLGGKVYFDQYDWRVGTLSVSRSFGDIDTKPYVSHIPDVYNFTVTKKDKFIIMACDGLWDVMSNQEVILFILENPVNTAKKLAKYAIDVKGTTDNVTILIIYL
jgi:serine/threonine protein phosphatase PrpC